MRMVRLSQEPWFWWSALAGALGSAVTSVPVVVYVLVALMALDILIGLAAAGIAGNINRAAAWRGALRKSVIIGVMAAVMLMQTQIAILMQTGLAPIMGEAPANIPFTEAVGGVFIVYEFISILENATRAGVRLPDALVRMLQAGIEHKGRDRNK